MIKVSAGQSQSWPPQTFSQTKSWRLKINSSAELSERVLSVVYKLFDTQDSRWHAVFNEIIWRMIFTNLNLNLLICLVLLFLLTPFTVQHTCTRKTWCSITITIFILDYPCLYRLKWTFSSLWKHLKSSIISPGIVDGALLPFIEINLFVNWFVLCLVCCLLCVFLITIYCYSNVDLRKLLSP